MSFSNGILIRRLADQGQTPAFPFKKLPTEIRLKIWEIACKDIFPKGPTVLVRSNLCKCQRARSATLLVENQRRVVPQLLGEFKHEFARVFFAKRQFRFRCSCELLDRLARNPLLVANLTNAEVYWRGPYSAEAFRMLAKCPRLDMLFIQVARETFININDRTKLVRTYFHRYRSTSWEDLLGFEELLKIRGVKNVFVDGIIVGRQFSDNTCEALESLLDDQLTQHKAGPH